MIEKLRHLIELGHGELAEHLCRQQLDQAPGDAAVRFLLATLLYGRKDWPGSATQLETLLRHQPDDLEARKMLAAVYHMQGRVRDAVRELTETFRRGPVDYEAWRPFKDELKHEAWFIQRLLQPTEDAQAEYGRAQLLLECDYLDAAVEAVRRALVMAPDNFVYQDVQIDVLIRTGRMDEAVQAMRDRMTQSEGRGVEAGALVVSTQDWPGTPEACRSPSADSLREESFW